MRITRDCMAGEMISFVLKLLILIIIILVIGFILLQCFGGGSCIKRIDKTLPDIDIAPWEITTPTHIYYAKEVIDNGIDSIDIVSWYEKINDIWVYRKEALPLTDIWLYNEIEFKRR